VHGTDRLKTDFLLLGGADKIGFVMFSHVYG